MTGFEGAGRSRTILPRQIVAGVLALVIAGIGALYGATPARATTTGYGLDANFNDKFGTGFDGSVNVVVPMDGGYLVGGDFTKYQGVNVGHLARLDADLNLDIGFNNALGHGFNSTVQDVVPVDGGYLVSGSFTVYGDYLAAGLVRLDENLNLDHDFNAALGSGFAGLSPNVYDVELVDGGYLVSGFFTTYQGVDVGRMVRLDEGLNLDADFNAALGSGFNYTVRDVVPVEGGYLVGGWFSSYQGVDVGNLVRLDEDLNLDTDFNAAVGSGFTGVSPGVNHVELVDGGYLVGGHFTGYQGVNVGRLARLNEDLSLDTDFNAALGSGFNDYVYSAFPVDGGYLVGGYFRQFRGVSARYLAQVVSVTVTAGQVADRSDMQGVEVVPEALSVDVAPAGVVRPVVFSATGLPSGLSLDAESGQITGTPTTPGTYTVQVTATVGGVPDSTSFDWTIQQAPVAPSITGIAVDGVVGQAFSFVPVLGGVPDPTVTSVDLPDWANLDASTGAVTGTPTEPGSVSFTLTASNGTAPDATLDVTFEVAAAPVVAGPVWAELEHAERAPGQTQSVVGGGFVPGDQVGVVMNSRTVDLGTVPVDGQGQVALSFVVPDDTEAGTHTVTLTGTNGTTSATFTVTAAPGTPGPPNTGEDTSEGTSEGALAQTGADTLAIVTLAVLVILLGATLTRTTRARRHTHS